MARQRSDALKHYHEIVWYDLDDGGGAWLREAREKIGQVNDEIKDLDELVIEGVIVNDLWPDVYNDANDQPLEKWWWHLGKIRNKTFPADQLPDYLQAVYQETK